MKRLNYLRTLVLPYGTFHDSTFIYLDIRPNTENHNQLPKPSKNVPSNNDYFLFKLSKFWGGQVFTSSNTMGNKEEQVISKI